MDSRLTDNKQLSVFEFQTDNGTSQVMYAKRKNVLYLNYAFVPSEMRGKGVGAEMMGAVLGYARENGLLVVPICSYTVRYIKEHDEWDDLLYNP